MNCYNQLCLTKKKKKKKSDPGKSFPVALLSAEELTLLHSMMFAYCCLDMFSPIWRVEKRNPWFYSDVSVAEIQRMRFGVP